MKLKWNRASILLAVVIGLIIIGTFIFGQIYYLNPIKEQSKVVAQEVEKQEKLKSDYPPETTLLKDYKQKYEKTWSFLPEGERVDQELIELEKLAAKEKVTVQQLIRLDEPQLIEGFDENYKKSSYELSLTSPTVGNIQNLITKLEDFERIWNIHTFSFEKLDEGSFSATVTFELFYYLKTTD